MKTTTNLRIELEKMFENDKTIAFNTSRHITALRQDFIKAHNLTVVSNIKRNQLISYNEMIKTHVAFGTSAGCDRITYLLKDEVIALLNKKVVI